MHLNPLEDEGLPPFCSSMGFRGEQAGVPVSSAIQNTASQTTALIPKRQRISDQCDKFYDLIIAGQFVSVDHIPKVTVKFPPDICPEFFGFGKDHRFA